ncbi:CesT family type III secretion system chaperone [Variovorax saccharolyticus]|uniref:CesT family type III secretion system chaperone n=1 Tax=Variovorax saccharolyticus TaxID=3053516 RepID=UPI002576AAB4|nr:CesT family type III secretion system chaperone [Variovorax sp. J31P216]MDM0030177.1 CesT family type III secretion system chaperone [Variovorax sp. J31P216]
MARAPKTAWDPVLAELAGALGIDAASAFRSDGSMSVRLRDVRLFLEGVADGALVLAAPLASMPSDAAAAAALVEAVVTRGVPSFGSYRPVLGVVRQHLLLQLRIPPGTLDVLGLRQVCARFAKDAIRRKEFASQALIGARPSLRRVRHDLV